jgi:hypothetical protein
MKIKGYPCDLCEGRDCLEENCPRWQDWFLNRWEDIHAAAWDMIDQGWRSRGFTYEMRHMRRCPCADSPCEVWCHKPCTGKRI